MYSLSQELSAPDTHFQQTATIDVAFYTPGGSYMTANILLYYQKAEN